jgi:hypothetical protein
MGLRVELHEILLAMPWLWQYFSHGPQVCYLVADQIQLGQHQCLRGKAVLFRYKDEPRAASLTVCTTTIVFMASANNPY